MPHVGRRMLVVLDADLERVTEVANSTLDLEPVDGALVGRLSGSSDPTATFRVRLAPEGAGTRVELEAVSGFHVPYFGWFVRVISWLSARPLLRYAADRLGAALDGRPPPDPPKRPPMMPPVPFTADQAARLAAIAAAAAIANFGGALLTQNGDAVIRTFDRSNQALTLALAISRVGVLVSLVAAALADRIGRRRLVIACVLGIAVANGASAVAPTFETFTVGQVFSRGFVNALLVVGAIAVVEEAPERARAYALSMFGLAIGLGFGASVALLPLADIGDNGWRLAFGASALTVLLLPGVARNVRETKRFRAVESRTTIRERTREIFDVRYRSRFILLGMVSFLSNMFSAPSSQLTNRYLTDEHDFSNSQVAVLRSATAGVPGFLGVLLAGRLAESRGRRPVMAFGLVIASLFQMVFFLGSGALLWITPAIAIVAAACAGLAVGTVDAELFPTQSRGTSNGFLLVCAVSGSATGLLLAGFLDDMVGGLGIAIALCGIAPIVAAVLIVPRLPETRARTLDDISPSEVEK